MEPIKYGSIGQFRHLIKDIQRVNDGEPRKVLLFGTVKVHGTNASVIIQPDGSQYPQSRNNILSVENDNLGFAKWHADNKRVFKELADRIHTYDETTKRSTIVIYGEWAGKGIQKGVAVSEVERFFYIFGVKIVDQFDKWLRYYPSLSHPGATSPIIDARDIWYKSILIDFSNPLESQNQLVAFTETVEGNCPVGDYFGVHGVGEGVVWETINNEGVRFNCKVKGEKHSVSKVKKLAPIDTDKLNSINEFVEYAVTENRLRQGLFEVCNNNPDRQLLGAFIKWVSSDIMKEELDTLQDNGLNMRDVGRTLSEKARRWFFEQEVAHDEFLQ